MDMDMIMGDMDHCCTQTCGMWMRVARLAARGRGVVVLSLVVRIDV